MSSLFLEPRHVYDHGTIWTNTVITYFSFSFKYRLLLPLVCQFQVCSTKSNHPILFFVVVRYYHFQPFCIVLDIHICCGDFIPQCFVDIPCTRSSHSVSYLGQTRFLIKPLLLSNVVTTIQFLHTLTFYSCIFLFTFTNKKDLPQLFTVSLYILNNLIH